MTIKAIETHYAGCRFRSRLEARWAVFFDTAGIGWEYEPQGFNIDGRNYLPDFRLTSCGTWVEVKGRLTSDEYAFLNKAADHLPVENANGEAGESLMIVGPIPRLPVGDRALDFTWWPSHGFGNYLKNNRPWWQLGGPMPPAADICTDEVMHPRIEVAYLAARRARFEWGARGV